MTTAEFLSQLRTRDIRVWVEGDRLRCNSPAGGLSPELKEELARRKPEIMTFLRAAEHWSTSSALVPIQATGSQTPFFGVPGHNGDVFCYVRLASHLGDDQPLYALQPPGLDARRPPLDRIEDLATYFVTEMRGFQPSGPYMIGGYCAGGVVAFEMAQRLLAQGQEVLLLALFASPSPRALGRQHQVRVQARQLREWVAKHLRRLAALAGRERSAYLRATVGAVRARRTVERGSAEGRYRRRVERATLSAVRRYRPHLYPGRMTLLLPNSDEVSLADDRCLDWRAFAADFDVEVVSHHGRPDNMLQEPYAQAAAERLRQCLNRASATTLLPLR